MAANNPLKIEQVKLEKEIITTDNQLFLNLLETNESHIKIEQMRVGKYEIEIKAGQKGNQKSAMCWNYYIPS